MNLRGINIDNLKMLREVENAQPVLVVEGELMNPGTTDREVPAIRFALRGDDAQEDLRPDVHAFSRVRAC